MKKNGQSKRATALFAAPRSTWADSWASQAAAAYLGTSTALLDAGIGVGTLGFETFDAFTGRLEKWVERVNSMPEPQSSALP